jgi:molecular chaperone Hsp33
MIVVAHADGDVKGYAHNSHVDVPLDEEKIVQRAVGRKGYLYVTYDLGLKEPYTGSVRLVNSEIAQDLTAYFYRSEQIPSLIALGVFLERPGVAAAGGIIIQMMPGADELGYPDLLKDIAREIPPVSKMIRGKVTPEEILSLYLGRMDPVLVERMEFRFRCDCNRRRLGRLILGFPELEIRDLLEREGKIEGQCHFCSKKYVFTPEQLEKMRQTPNESFRAYPLRRRGRKDKPKGHQ